MRARWVGGQVMSGKMDGERWVDVWMDGWKQDGAWTDRWEMVHGCVAG